MTITHVAHQGTKEHGTISRFTQLISPGKYEDRLGGAPEKVGQKKESQINQNPSTVNRYASLHPGRRSSLAPGSEGVHFGFLREVGNN
jgi:hypothetical protein